MRCHEVRQYLYAFADGELEVKDNLELLAHLNMCPDCAERVDVEQQLKKRVAEAFAGERAPEALAARIRKRVGSPRADRRVGPHVLVRLGPALAAAAVIALVALVWIETRPGDSSRARGAVLDDPTYRVAAADLPACFEMGHQACSAIGSSHHQSGLPKDLDQIAATLSAELGYPVLAPDWSAQKLRFVSACRCGMPGGMAGAHLVYDRYTHVEPVSLYSMQPGGPFGEFKETTVKDKTYLVARAGDTSLVAWQEARAEYVLCARAADREVPELISRLVDPIRVALLEAPPAALPALAAANPLRRVGSSVLTPLQSSLALIRYPELPSAGRNRR